MQTINLISVGDNPTDIFKKQFWRYNEKNYNDDNDVTCSNVNT